VWTGTYLIVWGGRNSEGGLEPQGRRYDPLIDAWSDISIQDQPEPRERHVAIWTGSEMVVWGGSSNGHLSSGGRYDPITDSWTPTNEQDAPIGKENSTAVWTGTEMILFGGERQDQDLSCQAGEFAYAPATDSWRTLPSPPINGCRHDHTAVWTGTEMIVWGGWFNDTVGGPLAYADGARYDPSANEWTQVSNVNAPDSRRFHVATWAGSKMILWGGNFAANYRDGFEYDPASDEWTPLSTVGPPVEPTTGPVLTAIGNGELLLCCDSEGRGWRYHLGHDRWSKIPRFHVATQDAYWAWTGSELVVTDVAHTARFFPESEQWIGGGVHAERRMRSASVWTGTQWIVWGGEAASFAAERRDGWLYDPLIDARIDMAPAPESRESPAAIWTGKEMIVWRGFPGGEPFHYEPAADTWRRGSSQGAPQDNSDPPAVWTGEEMIVWTGPDGARYDPNTRQWMPMSSVGGPSSTIGHTMVWTGQEAIVWGGHDGLSVLNAGARYDPVGDAWTPVSTTGAPEARQDARAVWTGTEMVVWGGSVGGGMLDSGGRYDPATDSWTPMAMTSAPEARRLHTMEWTGSEVIVWGGDTPGADVNTGGRYDPATDTWSPMSLVGAPEARRYHVDDWTGEFLLVWGGEPVSGPPLATGGRYAALSPDTDTDGIRDGCDNCPNDPNATQTDTDADGAGDVCDSCPSLADPVQVDTDADGFGDPCDPDDDGDGVTDAADNCPLVPNADQSDGDFDGVGDVCDSCPTDSGNDPDGDSVCAGVDNCPDAYNDDQSDVDADGLGDACDPCEQDMANDGDGDLQCEPYDNCPVIFNRLQLDRDIDGFGDLCDVCPDDNSNTDADVDGTPDVCDCEPQDPNDRGLPEVPQLSVNRGAGGATLLAWSAVAGADAYPITRGNVAALGPGDYGDCHAIAVTASAEDLDMPGSGQGFAYLVQAESVECGAGTLGYDGRERERLNLNAGACAPVSATDAGAESEQAVAGTILFGSYLDTQVSDDIDERIEEVLSSGGPPGSRHSLLEHHWTFTIPDGSKIELHVEGSHVQRSDGDELVFEYSSDGVNFTPVPAIALPKGTTDDDVDRVGDLPSTLSGPVTIRVVDTDHSAGAQELDWVDIDRIWIRVLP
jgi:N-acetylneuraminic acid mutarotase